MFGRMKFALVLCFMKTGHRLIPDYSANSKDPDQPVEIV